MQLLDNDLLGALSAATRSRLADAFERVRLAHRATLYAPGDAVTSVYFPIDAVISVVTVMSDGTQIETVTVGREGLTGAQALLDGSPASGLTWCQVAGDAYRISYTALAELCGVYRTLRVLVERYMSAQIDVMAQSIACNRLHYVNERCARWLLMTHDRVGRDEFPLTHEGLATKLGVRRAGVSIAAAALQQAGAIRYARGKVAIADRAQLEDAACECYGAINDAYHRRRLAAS
ncbi:Crp/Fnr family transcriptional regulator [Vulcanimicrobium alpinum]|uniref:Crp/Fnr family transcriptional regulator n=1 Tax=Vulcanimicrobium alpinum TaxID=3016050 RepID=UPI00386E16F8